MGVLSAFTAEFWALSTRVSSLSQIDFSRSPDHVGTDDALDISTKAKPLGRPV